MLFRSVGLDVAEAAGLSVGSTVSVEYLSSDNLQLVSSDGEQDQDSAPAGQAQWRVAGIVDTGGKEDGIIYALGNPMILTCSLRSKHLLSAWNALCTPKIIRRMFYKLCSTFTFNSLAFYTNLFFTYTTS